MKTTSARIEIARGVSVVTPVHSVGEALAAAAEWTKPCKCGAGVESRVALAWRRGDRSGVGVRCCQCGRVAWLSVRRADGAEYLSAFETREESAARRAGAVQSAPQEQTVPQTETHAEVDDDLPF